MSMRAEAMRTGTLLLGILLLVGCAVPAPTDSSAPGSESRTALSADFLLGDAALAAPAATEAFAPPSSASRALSTAPAPHAAHFQGVLELTGAPAGQIRALTDRFDYLQDAALRIDRLPPFRFAFVQDGDALLPVLRGPQVSTHPHWEFILEPGAVWAEAADGGWSRAALPFALQERNANCTHNGLLTFLFRADGAVSRVAWQIGSETCQYLQLDFWGVAEARYTPGAVAGADRVITDFRAERAARLPVKPLSALAADYPGTDPADFDWFPPAEVSAVGFAIDGVHYRGGCDTRYGPYPFCDVLDLPSYSLAKSMFAGLAYLVLQREAPDVGRATVSSLVPECNDERWQGVTLENLLDMATGNYLSLEPDADEFASYETDFMAGETHAAKIGTACTLFPRQAPPGTTFAYHTTDTYIAGTLMNAWLAQRAAATGTPARDVHADVLVAEVFRPLGLSPVAHHSKRSYDAIAQPFAGYGLTLHTDDIARLGLFLLQSGGAIDGRQVLDSAELEATLQQHPADRGLPAGSDELRYNNGFWAYRSDLGGACREPVWIPLMSGYGGISIALLPNQSLFYVFSDHGRFEWLQAAVAAHRIRPICE